ncbi:alpha/beta fold hydrolase [Actinomyces bowdenii]|uniref:Alpha/beta hydrolase n=1 Tax=Actinomyces bowdenii TaxID=131109 RepID=A0A853EHQ5_9ACTO|nr:alpha/beta hydrolase [Actinomyces bowdenii]MBF0696511.1 alpha/beta hydrolase [Actinomyces bowdenii]MDO5065431.1 alpha/beta hydrolase [Actinomyces bowdenii]NYS68684.1 alpha/beta hydrolase [Actinomyces bowdenii]
MSSLARIIIGPPAAPALVLLHGITGSAISQAEAIEHWAERGYRVIALDARGHGLSPRWSPEELARAGQVLVDDVVETLEELAHEGSALPILIGHSMGAATAMVLATQRPDLVAGLVLEDPALYGTRSPAELLARGAARERSRAAEAADPAASVSQALESRAMPAAEAVVGVWAAQRSDPALLLSGVVTPEVPWTDAVAALEVPALLLTGDQPGSARVGPAGLERIAALNPRIETVLVPGAGHQVRRSDPQAYYSAVDTWLERQGMAPQPPRQ